MPMCFRHSQAFINRERYQCAAATWNARNAMENNTENTRHTVTTLCVFLSSFSSEDTLTAQGS